VYRLAGRLDPLAPAERQRLATTCLERGESAGFRELTGLAQAKLAYVAEVLDICSRFRCKAFASIRADKPDAPHGPDYLRKDHSFLFEKVLLLPGGFRAGQTGHHRL